MLKRLVIKKNIGYQLSMITIKLYKFITNWPALHLRVTLAELRRSI